MDSSPPDGGPQEPLRIPIPKDLLVRRAPAIQVAPPSLNVAPHLKELSGQTLVLFRDATDGEDEWTVNDSFEGVQVLGATGSGKTSGSGRELAYAFLQRGYGGLVLTAKPEERARWERYCRQAGRGKDLRVVKPGGPHRLNFLDYVNKTHGEVPLTQNLVSLFMRALGPGSGASVSSDQYWDDALRQMLTHAIDLVALASDTLALRDIARVIREAPQSSAEAYSRSWQATSSCWQLLEKAQVRTTASARREDFHETVEYWLNDFAKLAARTRSVIVSSFTSKATGLLRSPLRELFCTTTTIRPEDSFEGRILLIDLPLKDYGEVGRFAQILFKSLWQDAGESSRRDLSGADARPAFLWADESQFFVTPEDMLFQTTARSKMIATVYLTQNVPNYYAALNGRSGTAATDSLLGSLGTKIFHANGDPVTNEWAARVVGQTKKLQFGTSLSPSTNASQVSAMSHDLRHAYEDNVPASAFTTLQKGGGSPGQPSIVTALLFQGGRVWQNGHTYRTAAFDQNASPELADR